MGKMKKRIIAVVIALGFVGIARATLVDSNSIVQDDIEYYIQTDKAIYDLGENVQMLYRVTNLGTEDVTFSFGGDPEWNFWVEKDGDYVWQAVEGWWATIVNFTLAPSEYKEYPYEWDMRDNDGVLVSLGEYNVIGGFDAGVPDNYEYSRVSVPIVIIPEPCSLTLFAAGLCILNHFNNKRRNNYVEREKL